MTTRKLSLVRVGALVVFVAAMEQLAIAQTGQRKSSAQAVTPVQTGPVSRPVNAGSLRPTSGPLVVLLPTEPECKGIGGKVVDVQTSSCASGKQCVTANEDNTTHYKCIAKQ